MAQVIIGVDPHELAATIEVVYTQGQLLGGACFGTAEPAMPRCSGT